MKSKSKLNLIPETEIELTASVLTAYWQPTNRGLPKQMSSSWVSIRCNVKSNDRNKNRTLLVLFTQCMYIWNPREQNITGSPHEQEMYKELAVIAVNESE